MTEPESFNVQDRAKSFGHAMRGIAALVREEHNAWIHVGATVAVVVAGMLLDVSRLDWCALVLAMALVWGAEAMNTAIEHIADAAVPERHPLVAQAKDVAAGAVLLCAIGAAIVAAIVFLPRVAELLGT